MLVVEVTRDQAGDILVLRATGHTGFAPRGKDIVCAGASAILHTAALGVVRHLGVSARMDADEGYLELALEKDRRELDAAEAERWRQAQAVLETAVLGIQEMERQYPRHVRLKLRESRMHPAERNEGV